MDDTAQSPQPLAQGQGGQQPVSQPSVAQPPLDNAQIAYVEQPGGLQSQPQQPVSQSFVPTEPVIQSQMPSQHADTISVAGKEHEAVVVAEVQPAQPEVQISQEVQEAGVEAVASEEPQLSDEHKEAGIEAAKEAVPLPKGSTTVQLPEDYKAPKGFFSLLQQHVKNTATWLYLLLFKAQQQAARQAAQEKKNV